MDASLVHLLVPPCTTKQSQHLQARTPPLRPTTCVVVTRESRLRFAEHARTNEQVNYSACNTVSTSARLSSESCEKLRAGRTHRSKKGNAIKAHGQRIRTQAGSALTSSLLYKTKRQGNHTNKKATSSIRLLPYTLPSPQSIPDRKVPHLELRSANTQR